MGVEAKRHETPDGYVRVAIEAYKHAEKETATENENESVAQLIVSLRRHAREDWLERFGYRWDEVVDEDGSKKGCSEQRAASNVR